MVKNMYFGSYEFETKRMIEKCLKPGAAFIDIGANVGYFTAVGASCVGKTGQVHCFEPIPNYFAHIQKIIELNPDYKIIANNLALGEENSQVSIASHQNNIGASSIVPNFVPKEDVSKTLNIQVRRLDEYIKENKLTNISLIKIDTEGFEFPVLLGASQFFEQNKNNLPFIIAEITPRAFELMKKDLNELKDFMASYGYKTYAICGRHKIDIAKLTKQTDVLFKP
ncbi:MAG: FkbM family methyltransferase [Planctomycetes bacterium]|nr:FkbM family methyltransferase [Planctomycetota bacterium]